MNVPGYLYFLIAVTLSYRNPLLAYNFSSLLILILSHQYQSVCRVPLILLQITRGCCTRDCTIIPQSKEYTRVPGKYILNRIEYTIASYRSASDKMLFIIGTIVRYVTVLNMCVCAYTQHKRTAARKAKDHYSYDDVFCR